jgi:hypothetical protein
MRAEEFESSIDKLKENLTKCLQEFESVYDLAEYSQEYRLSLFEIKDKIYNLQTAIQKFQLR